MNPTLNARRPDPAAAGIPGRPCGSGLRRLQYVGPDGKPTSRRQARLPTRRLGRSGGPPAGPARCGRQEDRPSHGALEVNVLQLCLPHPHLVELVACRRKSPSCSSSWASLATASTWANSRPRPRPAFDHPSGLPGPRPPARQPHHPPGHQEQQRTSDAHPRPGPRRGVRPRLGLHRAPRLFGLGCLLLLHGVLHPGRRPLGGVRGRPPRALHGLRRHVLGGLHGGGDAATSAGGPHVRR